MLRPDKLVTTLELKIHYRNYKILGKNTSYRNQTEG